VCDEANVECHGALPMGRFAMDPAFKAAMVARAQRMVARDTSHPSVQTRGVCVGWGLFLTKRIAARAAFAVLARLPF
jgi:hypothetical protein